MSLSAARLIGGGEPPSTAATRIQKGLTPVSRSDPLSQDPYRIPRPRQLVNDFAPYSGDAAASVYRPAMRKRRRLLQQAHGREAGDGQSHCVGIGLHPRLVESRKRAVV